MELFLALLEVSFTLLLVALLLKRFDDMAERESVSDRIEKIKMLFPKYKAQAKINKAYELLEMNYYEIKRKHSKSKKDKANLREIEDSMKMLLPHVTNR